MLCTAYIKDTLISIACDYEEQGYKAAQEVKAWVARCHDPLFKDSESAFALCGDYVSDCLEAFHRRDEIMKLMNQVSE